MNVYEQYLTPDELAARDLFVEMEAKRDGASISFISAVNREGFETSLRSLELIDWDAAVEKINNQLFPAG